MGDVNLLTVTGILIMIMIVIHNEGGRMDINKNKTIHEKKKEEKRIFYSTCCLQLQPTNIIET
jgi:hypothetical protein